MADARERKQRYVASPDQVSTTVGGEAVILGMRDGVYFGLNAVGARAWALLAQPRSVAELCSVISSEFDVQPERCAADMATLLADLQQRGLIRPAPDEPSATDQSIGR